MLSGVPEAETLREAENWKKFRRLKRQPRKQLRGSRGSVEAEKRRGRRAGRVEALEKQKVCRGDAEAGTERKEERSSGLERQKNWKNSALERQLWQKRLRRLGYSVQKSLKKQ